MSSVKTFCAGLYFILLFSTVSVSAQSQQIILEIKKINQSFDAKPNVSMDIVYNVYKNHFSMKPYETTTGKFRKSGTNHWLRMSELETANFGKYTITADYATQYLLIANRIETNGFGSLTAGLDSIIKYVDKASITEIGERNKITLEFLTKSNYAEFRKVEVFYNRQEKVMEKLVMYYAQPVNLDDQEDGLKEAPRLEIIYQNFEYTPIIEVGLFSAKTYFVQSGKKSVPVGKYKAFTLFDQRIKK